MGMYSAVIHPIGWPTGTFPNTSAPIAEIVAGPTSSPSIKRIYCAPGFVNTGGANTQLVCGIGIPAVSGSGPYIVESFVPWDPQDPSTDTKIVSRWVTMPTVPTRYHRTCIMQQSGAQNGQTYSFVFNKGLIIAPNSSIVFWMRNVLVAIRGDIGEFIVDIEE